MKIRSPRYHREIPQRYRYEAEKGSDGNVYFPPRIHYTGGVTTEKHILAREGSLISWTVMSVTMAEYGDLTPYAVGIVELDDGARLTAMMAEVPFEEIKIGMRLWIEFRKIRQEGHEGLLCYGYKMVRA